jgi:hypothetical protein
MLKNIKWLLSALAFNILVKISYELPEQKLLEQLPEQLEFEF